MDLALATAYVEFKGRGDLTGIINSNRAALKSLESDYAGGYLGRAMTEQRRIDIRSKELNQLAQYDATQRASSTGELTRIYARHRAMEAVVKSIDALNNKAKYEFLEQTQGKVASYLTQATDRLDRFSAKFAGVSRLAGGVGVGAMGAIVGTASLGSPFEAQQFMWAIKDLTAVVGQTLTPALRVVTSFVRGFADIIANIPEPMKYLISYVTVAAGAIGLGTWAWHKATGMIGLATKELAAFAGVLKLGVAAKIAPMAQVASASQAMVAGMAMYGSGSSTPTAQLTSSSTSTAVSAGATAWLMRGVVSKLTWVGLGIWAVYELFGRGGKSSVGAAPRDVTVTQDLTAAYRATQQKIFEQYKLGSGGLSPEGMAAQLEARQLTVMQSIYDWLVSTGLTGGRLGEGWGQERDERIFQERMRLGRLRE